MASKERPKKMGLQWRFAEVKRDAIDTEARTMAVAFSSEHPVERWWGVEVLDHSPQSVRLGRMQNGGAVLLDHDPRSHVGVVEDVQIDADRMGRAVLRFGKSQRAEEVWQDVLDGIRRHVSVGYAIHRSKLEEQGSDSPDKYRVTDWEPYEISLVAVPADPNVGVGRAESREFDLEIEIPEQITEERAMTTEVQTPAPSVDVKAVENEAREAERARVREILAAGALHNRSEMAQKAVSEGASLSDFRETLLAEIAKAQPAKTDPGIGLSDSEARQFSYLRAIRSLMNPNDRKVQEEAGFEREVSRAAAQKSGKPERGIVIPVDVLSKRDLITGTATSTAKGGNLIQTDVLGASFIDVLRNSMVLPAVGARFMTGLQGNVAIPKRTTSVTAYWPGENTAPTEGANVFGQVTMSPKTLAAYIDIGRRLALQSSVDVEALVRDDLAQTLAIAIDEAALGAAKTNGPTGLRGTSGIGSVAIGTNGGAPTWASIVNLVKEVEVDNALTGSAAFVTNPKVKAKLSQTPKQASGVEGNFLLGPPWNDLYGFPFVVSNQIPSTLTKGTSTSVCSAMFFGVWSNLVVGQWGGIELMVDPYSLSTTGATRIVALAELDVCVRLPEHFAAVLDYTTT
jgi:HK97 family phage major capsid protein